MRVFAQHAAPRGNPRLHIRDVPPGETIRATRHANPVRTICGATLPAGSHDVAPVTPARLAALATITPGAPGWLCQTCRDRNDKPTTRTGAPAMTAQKTGAIPYKAGDSVSLITASRHGRGHGYATRRIAKVVRVLKSAVVLGGDRSIRLKPSAGAWVDASIAARDITSSTQTYILTEPGSVLDNLAVAAIRRAVAEDKVARHAQKLPTSPDPLADSRELYQLARALHTAVTQHLAAEAAYKAAQR